MAEQFRRNGYETGAIHSNPYVSRLRNFHRGFDTFEENIVPFNPDGVVDNAPDTVLLVANKLARVLRRTPYKPASAVNEELRAWARDAEEPWFLWTQYMDVHGPYLPGNDLTYRNKFRAERLWRKAAVTAPGDVTDAEHEELWTNYRKEVEYLDRKIGRLLDDLEESGDFANTAVVVVGDHGDEFIEHGRYGHGNLPYDELTHVPCIVRFPEDAGVNQPAEVDDLVRTVDLLPTLLDLADADLSEEMEDRMVGESLLPVAEGAEPSYDIVVTENEMGGDGALRFGFRAEEWKYLYDGQIDEHLLYDLAADPDEKSDVSADYPNVLARFRKRLDERLASIEATSEGVDVPDVGDREGEAVSERLEALGYK